MSDFTHVQLVKGKCQGPYGVPLKVLDENDHRLLIEVEIDDACHGFQLKKKSIKEMSRNKYDPSIAMVSIADEDMNDLFRRISSVALSERNGFIR